jgi:hypothetical protein
MSLTKKMDRLLKQRPTYTINEEAFENQALAKSAAFGRDRSVQMQEQQLEQDASNAVSQAKDVTSSTSGLLSTIASIQSNMSTAGRDLATTEAQIKREKMQDLYGANEAMINEKDKAFDFNVNQPYQNKIQSLRDRKKARSELAGSIIGGLTSIGASASTGGLSTLLK